MPKSKKKPTNNKAKKDVSNEIKEDVKVEEVEEVKETKTTKSSKNKSNNKKTNNKKQQKSDTNKRWFKEFRAELKKIIWPSRSELLENSIVVISMVVVVAVIIFVLDLAFKSLNGLEVEGAKKLKNSISVEETLDEGDTDAESESEESEDANENTAVELTPEDGNGVQAVWTEESTEAGE